MKQLALGALLAAARLGAQAIQVEDIMESVRHRYPPLLAALAEREIADGEAIAAEGRFDTTLRSRFDSDSFGYYSNQRADAWLEQPLSWQGMSLYSGYRVGEGDFATYDGKLATRSLGEARAGFRLPLFRDREIDSRRGELAKARIGGKLASLGADQQKLIVLQAAIARYWTWVALGRRLTVTREVLQTAEARHKLLEESVRAGQTPRIEAVDNERAILQRRSALIEAERAFQQSAIELSLYYRDPSSGAPVTLGLERVPAQTTEPALIRAEDLAADRRIALERRPELKRLEAQAGQIDVDARMARNAAKPAVDLVAGFTAGSGSGAAVRRGPQELKAGLSFDLPWQNRAARGRERVAEAKGRQLEIRAGFLRDQIAAEVEDAFSAVRAAHGRLRLLGDEVRVSRELEDAERSRFELGEGTLFVLNLREQATLDAAVREALAQADYRRAHAAYDYATGAWVGRQ